MNIDAFKADLIREGKAELFRVGDSCSVPAGTIHAEHVRPEGVAYLSGRRQLIGCPKDTSD